jgi:hypothetical protein
MGTMAPDLMGAAAGAAGSSLIDRAVNRALFSGLATGEKAEADPTRRTARRFPYFTMVGIASLMTKKEEGSCV